MLFPFLYLRMGMTLVGQGDGGDWDGWHRSPGTSCFPPPQPHLRGHWPSQNPGSGGLCPSSPCPHIVSSFPLTLPLLLPVLGQGHPRALHGPRKEASSLLDVRTHAARSHLSRTSLAGVVPRPEMSSWALCTVQSCHAAPQTTPKPPAVTC